MTSNSNPPVNALVEQLSRSKRIDAWLYDSSNGTRGSAGIREKNSRIRFKLLMLRAFLPHTPLRPRSGLLALRVETE